MISLEKYEQMNLVFLYNAFASCGSVTLIEILKEYLVEGKHRNRTFAKKLLEKEFDETIKLAKNLGLISIQENVGMVILLKKHFNLPSGK